MLYLEALCIFLYNQISSHPPEVTTMLKFVLIIPMVFCVIFSTLKYIPKQYVV